MINGISLSMCRAECTPGHTMISRSTSLDPRDIGESACLV